MKIRLASPIQYDSIVDGEGIRAVLWTQGCTHNCEGCHNPQTHKLDDGYLIDTLEIINELKTELKYQDGITLSGGDPFLQSEAVLEIAHFVKKEGKDVWAYTGYEFEKLLKLSKTNIFIKELLKNIDVLVDGKFDITKFSLDLYYKGSENQRIIDVKKSLEINKIVLIEKFKAKKQEKKLNVKKEYIFV